MNLIAIINQTEEIIETMWGDPNRWDDLQRRVYKLFLTLSNHDRENGYSLERLDLYEAAINPGEGSIRKRGTFPFGITQDSLILIVGPLYRADTFAFRDYELTEEEKSVLAIPFQGYNNPKTIETEYYDGEAKKDNRSQLRPLSIKTATHAIGYIPEQPVNIVGDDNSNQVALNILKDLDLRGIPYIRKKYFLHF
jgi:hypothetical protein